MKKVLVRQSGMQKIELERKSETNDHSSGTNDVINMIVGGGGGF